METLGRLSERQYETLRKNGLQHFDCWASTFRETVTAIKLAPEGTGYRAKTRFARFYNLPELMNMFLKKRYYFPGRKEKIVILSK